MGDECNLVGCILKWHGGLSMEWSFGYPPYGIEKYLKWVVKRFLSSLDVYDQNDFFYKIVKLKEGNWVVIRTRETLNIMK